MHAWFRSLPPGRPTGVGRRLGRASATGPNSVRGRRATARLYCGLALLLTASAAGRHSASAQAQRLTPAPAQRTGSPAAVAVARKAQGLAILPVPTAPPAPGIPCFSGSGSPLTSAARLPHAIGGAGSFDVALLPAEPSVPAAFASRASLTYAPMPARLAEPGGPAPAVEGATPAEAPAARPDATHSVALVLGARAVPVTVQTLSAPGSAAPTSESPAPGSAGSATPARTPGERNATPTRLTLTPGRSQVLSARGLRTLQIDDDKGTIAEVQALSDAEVLLLAKGPGVTMVRVWDQNGRQEYELTVEPAPAHQQQILQDAIGSADVRVRVVGDAAILEGDVEDAEQIRRAQTIAEAMAPRVVNLLRLAPTQTPVPVPTPAPVPTLAEQVQAILPAGEVTAEELPGQPTTVVLRGKVPHTEDLTTLEELAEKVVAGAQGTVVNLVQLAQPRQVRVQAQMLNVDEGAIRELGARWPDSLKIGQESAGASVKVLSPVQVDVHTLIQDTKAEVLAAPSVVVNSGGMGNIMIGGEVPIPVVVTGFTSAGGSAVGGTGSAGGTGQAGVGTVGQSIFFRQFGVLLNIEPVVEPDEEISLRLLAEVSTVDRNNAVTIQGSQIPGFATKRTITELRLRAGETLVIGGLISRDEARAVNKFPILGDLPVFGSFFRSVRRDKQTRELVLFLTPELLPGPEPPVGLRQSPALKPLVNIPLGYGAVGSGMAMNTSYGTTQGSASPNAPLGTGGSMPR